MSQGENQPLPTRNLLATLTRKPEINDIWYNSKSVQIDGYSFRSCRFDKCHLYVASSNFEMHRCFIDHQTIIYYSGEIVKLLRLFNSRYENVYRHLPYFAPTKHDDGTFTIVL